MYQVVLISQSPMRRAVITTLDTKDNAMRYLEGMPGDGEVVDVRTGLLLAEKNDGWVRAVLKPTRRDVL